MAVKFKLLKEGEEHCVLWDVMVPVPVDGGFEQRLLKVRFMVTGIDEYLAALGDGATANEVLKKVIVDLPELEQEGREGFAAFTPELLNRLLNFNYVSRALHNAYLDCINGRAAKN
ncbi:MAG: hypothetical protein ABL951_13120 [Alphaproteobacteria bacterium]